jgi:predicted NUDIX family NTP pyrophosphohydrolase
MKQSAGTLLYRSGPDGLEVLLIHASGNYNRHKPWSIPKGEPDPGETDLEATARRETLEETGVVAGQLTPIGSMKYSKSGKTIHGFAGPAPENAAPHCASWEIDQARFMPVEEARRLLHPEQAVFLDRLAELLRTERD